MVSAGHSGEESLLTLKTCRLTKQELRDAINRWGKEANTKFGVARMDMADTHTTLESIMPLILEFFVLYMIHLASRDGLFGQGGGTKGDQYKLDL